MRVLVLGGGGREHALCWRLGRSPSVAEVVCAPGNAGIEELADVVGVEAADPDEVLALARRLVPDLVVVGPEGPLVAGVADALVVGNFPVFGPTAAAARIEGSKAFAKDVMAAAGVATARHVVATDAAAARAALDGFAGPFVVKADGLAAGKGVVVTADRAEADAAVEHALGGAFGGAGATLVLEDFLEGPEVSLFGLCDGRDVVPLSPAQDFKRAGDGDAGPNTGGMGAYSPVPAVDASAVARLHDEVLAPVVAEMAARGTPFTGVLYAGLVLTAEGPRVLEFNARFGDPETQVVLPRLEGDLGELLAACAAGELAGAAAPAFTGDACVTVVLASGGYPGSYATGVPIAGLDAAAAVPGAVVFHAGTARDDHGTVVTAGGRVLAVSGLGRDLPTARRTAYQAADAIAFEGAHRRTDIAATPTGPKRPSTT